MTNEQFASLVSRLEGEARRNPSGYRFRVLLLACAGNVYLGSIVAIIAGLLVAAIASIVVLKALAIKIIAVIGAFLFLILKAAWVKVDPPQGIEITSREAPGLFAMIGELARALDAPSFDHVMVTEDFNAAVVQSPTLGVFGGYRNYLLIGLPLMKTLGVDQFKAVLAHEFGHLAKNHGRLSNWIYRQRLRWSRLMHLLDANESQGRFLFRPFLDRFAPYFNAYSFPLARANEYEADAASVRLTSPAAAAAALTRVNVVGSYFAERFWPEVHKQADHTPRPAFAPYAAMGQQVTVDLDEASTRGWLDRAMQRQTTLDDTHPALSDRLAAIGEVPNLAPPRAGDTADRLLGEALIPITETCDRRWKEGILPAWQQRHEEVQEARRRFSDLNAKHASGAELTPQETYDRALLSETVGNDEEDAFAQFRALHAVVPDDAVVCMALGARMLARDDSGGHALVERAMCLDEDLIVNGCEILRNHHFGKGRADDARDWNDKLLARAALEQAAAKERNQVVLADKFVQHDLPAESLEQLRRQLQGIGGIRKAYLVRKEVRFLPHRACYVLGFTVTGALQLYQQGKAAAVLDAIRQHVRFPGETMIVNAEGANARFAARLRRVAGASLLRRSHSVGRVENRRADNAKR